MTRLLVIDQEPPQATRDGGAARMIAVLRLLRDEGHAVTFVSLRPWPADLVGTAERLARLGVELAARDGAVAGWLQAEGQGLDVVIASRLPVAEAMLPLTRSSCPSARFIYDATHVEHLAKYRLAKLTGNRPLLAVALRDRSAERDVVAAADAVVTASEEDADELRRLWTGVDVHVVTAVHAAGDRTDLAAGPRAGIVFLGYLGMPENELAVRRLVDGVWPRVEAELGPTPLTVIGAAPPEWLVTAASDRPQLTVTGFLDEVDQPLREAAVLLVPLGGGSGVKSKVLHAFARHLPVVATADGLRGVPVVDGVHAFRGESDAELAAATVRILRNPALGRELAGRAAALLRERFNDDVSRAALRGALGSHG
jgi:glycosyltransferase involved in cell wall biosynthesis